MRPYFRDRRPSAESTELTVLLDASGSVTAEMADEARRLARKAMGRARAGEKVTLAALPADGCAVTEPVSWKASKNTRSRTRFISWNRFTGFG